MRVATALLLAAVAGLAWAGSVAPVGAAVAVRVQNNTPDVPVPHIIPRPNEGQAPKYSTDPGGSAQLAVFYGICGALVVIGGLVFLESRRKLRRRAAEEAAEAQRRSSTRSEPVTATSANVPDSIARQ
jgi:hypothetical protein